MKLLEEIKKMPGKHHSGHSIQTGSGAEFIIEVLPHRNP
jgi:hypothetical protein